MIPLNEDDLYYVLARKHKMSPDKVKYVINRMWGDVRRIMAKPSETKEGIMLSGFGKFYINPNKLEEYLSNKMRLGYSVEGEKDQELIKTFKMLTDGKEIKT